jgi:hypothetical protein
MQRTCGISKIAAVLEPALQPLTHLTHLSLGWIPSNASFPTSLVSLQIQDEIMMIPGRECLQLQRLTRLTHLEVGSVDSRAALPPSLRSLRVHQPGGLNLSVYADSQYMMEGFPDPRVDLDQLQNLQRLHLNSKPYNVSRL